MTWLDKARQSCLHEDMQALISVTEAESIISSHIHTGFTETVSFTDAYGRILREPVYSDRDLPPFNRVMMDGIAIKHLSWSELNRDFPIQGIQAAGTAALKLENEDHCIEVMTGCMLPEGCDTVIPIEQLNIQNSSAKIQACANIKHGQYIHQQGSDSAADNKLLEVGTKLLAPELSILASCGKTKVLVSKLPHILLLSTGDEVIHPHHKPLPHQIRRSHAAGLTASITSLQLGKVDTEHVNDDPEKLESVIHQALEKYDIIVMTGGVSRGKYDYVAPILKKLLGAPLFHGIAQKPGKPFAFWQKNEHPPVFALPGNPVSVIACAARYLFPALHKVVTGNIYQPDKLNVAGSFSCPPKFSSLTPAILSNGSLQLESSINSGNFIALTGSHGVAELPGTLSDQKLEGIDANYYPWS